MADYFNQESERLVFRKLTEDDVDSWLEFFENNNRTHFLGIDPTRPQIEVATEWIDKQIGRYKESGLGLLAVINKENNKLIGMCGIIPRALEAGHFFEIGYTLKPKYWGKGYATEAAKHMKSFGVENEISNQFISIIHIDNACSIKVAEKNGMSKLYKMEYIGMKVFVYGTSI